MRWSFDLYWGGTCVSGQPCNKERRFRIAVHDRGKLRCETAFSNMEIKRPHVIEFDLIESGETCVLRRALESSS